MMKDINLTWKADGIIDSYTIYRAENESLDVNNLPPPLIAGVTVKGYTDNYVGDATSLHYRVASVKGDRKKISGEYIVEIGGSDIPSNEMHFTTLAGSVDYVGTQGDQILLSDGTTVLITATGVTVTFNAPAGRHIVKLVEPVGGNDHVSVGGGALVEPVGGNGHVSVGGEALVELHNFPTLSTVTSFNFVIGNYNQLPNLTKVPDFLPSNITNISAMFASATSFNQPLNNWDVSNVTNMALMFANATSFNQPLNNWDVSNVTNMWGMFANETSFNQPLNNWDVSNVTNMDYMFYNATSFNQDLSNWCVSNILTTPVEFGLDATNWTQPRPVWGTCPVE